MPVNAKRIFRTMIPLKLGDMRPFAFLGAACRGAIPAKAVVADALGGQATPTPHLSVRGSPRGWPVHARSFRPTFGQPLGGPAATPG
ncbi:MAG TPA: hypothetical protein VH519_00295 [Hyphomicrobiaceae bacterium]|jgi:hypothetical protein